MDLSRHMTVLHTKMLIAQAARELHREGLWPPAKATLARRSGVSVRSIDRHYPKLEFILDFVLPGPWLTKMLAAFETRPLVEDPRTAMLHADLQAARELTPEEEQGMRERAVAYAEDPYYRALASDAWRREWRLPVLGALHRRPLRPGVPFPPVARLMVAESVMILRYSCFEVWHKNGFAHPLHYHVAEFSRFYHDVVRAASLRGLLAPTEGDDL